ncbi:hypothetical protein PLESTB_000198900 [Pleodorina starrii]|uniref:Cytosolic endo-beta-N-acetylglucosaminidase TIM barrel domain-containing protein n=1 Tax=Pleodorina starrii TaxID=330485 RepID=A0A9W6BCJ1_9CHLO|nr:hypothetical protein PLESTM_000332900 [Pleodorina starrii]GLC49250.1 hypothetical protein PLESTB_000198900 [Pleodorina starrii]GLC73496.1 hypothetical protein PLESTF_001384000 [Pleodorina starrii]
MGRRGRSFFGLVVVGCGAVALYLWRNRRKYRAFLAASDCVREFVKKTLRQQAETELEDALPKQIITGLEAPESRPLSTLEQFRSWSPTDPDAPFCQTYNAPLMAPQQPQPQAGAGGDAALVGGGGGSGGGTSGVGLGCDRPRLLVCHDMMGGYLEDRWVQGAADPGFFRLWQWDQIDAFIYFSHHLVTLPPPGWIAAAHRNGVRVLGTFITEWALGRSRCEALLSSPAAARTAADRLTALAAHHGFEGWLVNIENGLRRELVPHLATFLGHLRARMAAVVGPQAMVVWYDAITTEGKLAWQDGLTRLNAPFFDAADALFVNYRWGEAAPAAVAAAAGSRAADVFMGVDVFGRGSYGGGKDNCHVALHAARSAGLSSALFAPGWVFEEFPRDTFAQRQERFWAKIRSVWPARPALLQRLPLASCFNGGSGRGVWVEGVRVSSAPWFNLAAQDPVAATSPSAGAEEEQAPLASPSALPAGPVTAATAPSPLTVRPTHHLAFCGGSCLSLTLAPPEEAEAGAEGQAAPPPPTAAAGPWLHDLYSAHLPVPPAGLDLSYTVACAGASRVAVLLRTAPPGGAAGGPPAPLPAATAAAGDAGGGGGGGPRVGLAVGPWGPGDRAVVEALRRAGYSCIACPTTPTGATTRPLPDLGATATTATTAPAATSSSAAAAAASSAPAGLPWITCCAHLPYNLLAESASDALGGAVVTAVGIVCYRTAAGGAGGAPAAAAVGGGAPGGGGGGGSGRLSARGSTTGFAAAAAAVGGLEGCEGAPYQAFLGRLALREHRPTATAPSTGTGTGSHPNPLLKGPAALPEATPPPPAAGAEPSTAAAASAAAAAAAGQLGLPLAAAAPPPPPAPPLSGAYCFRVHWGRPGDSRPRSLRASFASLAGVGAAAAATAAAAAADIDPRVSGELVDSGDGVEVDEEEDEDWERSSGGGGGGGTAGGSPVKVMAPSGGGGGDGDGDGDVTLGGGEDGGGDAEGARLLTCELSWEPQFEGSYGTPRHRSYHVWAHFSASEAPAATTMGATVATPSGGGSAAAAAAAGSGGRLPPAKAAAAAAGSSSGGTGLARGDAKDSAWELLHPDWSGAVWAGEAFVARYRLVQLEVPGWARCVSLLVQPVSWQGAEAAQQLQPLARLPVPTLQ